MSTASAGVSAQETVRTFLNKTGDSFRSVPKRTWLGVGLALGLWWIFMYFTRWPSVQGKSEIMTVLSTGAPNTFNELVSRDGWAYWLSWIPTGINMNDNNAIGMAFAFLIAGAVSALVLPKQAVKGILHSTGTRGSAFGGLLGAPLMMCSACSVPVAVGWRRRGANLETTLGVVTGSALLNVMGLLTIWLLFPGPLSFSRLAVSLLMVLLVAPLTARLVLRYFAGDVPQMIAPRDPGTTMAGVPERESWMQALSGTLRAWWWASVAMAYRLFLPMTGAIFLAAFLRLLVPEPVVETYFGGGLYAIALVALFGTLIAIPTMFEIPLTIGFLFLGMGLGPAAALLITAPSVSVVSYFMLRKDIGHVAPLILLLATFLLGIAAGLAVEAGMNYYG